MACRIIEFLYDLLLSEIINRFFFKFQRRVNLKFLLIVHLRVVVFKMRDYRNDARTTTWMDQTLTDFET